MNNMEDKDNGEIVFDVGSASNNKPDSNSLLPGQQTTKINTSISMDSQSRGSFKKENKSLNLEMS